MGQHRNHVGAVDPQVQSFIHFVSAMTVMEAVTSHATNLAPMRTSVPYVRKEGTGQTAVTEGSVTRYGSQDMANGTIDLTVIRTLCLLTDTLRTVRIVEAIAGMIRRMIGNKDVAQAWRLGTWYTDGWRPGRKRGMSSLPPIRRKGLGMCMCHQKRVDT